MQGNPTSMRLWGLVKINTGKELDYPFGKLPHVLPCEGVHLCWRAQNLIFQEAISSLLEKVTMMLLPTWPILREKVPSALMRNYSIGSGAVAPEAVGVATLGVLVTAAGGATWGYTKALRGINYISNFSPKCYEFWPNLDEVVLKAKIPRRIIFNALDNIFKEISYWRWCVL